jgi:hypothetical protein
MAAGSPAIAGKRVMVLGLERQTSAHNAVIRILRRDHEVMPRRAVKREAARLGIDAECDPALVPGLASVLGAEAVVCGEVRRGKLTLKVINGGDGKVIRTVRIRMRGRGLSRSVRRKLAEVLAPALEKSWNWAADQVSNRPQSRPNNMRWEERPPTPMAERTVPAAPAAPPTAEGWEDNDGENPLVPTYKPKKKKRAEAVVREETTPSARRPEGAHAFRLSAGLALLLRRNYGVYGAANPRDAQGWKTTPAAGVAVAAEIYPGAWLTSGIGGDIGLGFSFSRCFGMSWRTSSDPQEHKAAHQSLSIDARARHRIVFGERTFLLGLQAGYRRTSFMMNDAAIPALVPDVAFSGLDLGARAQITVLPHWFTLSARFSYLPVFSRGEIAMPQEYGAGKGSGMLFGGGAQGMVYGNFGWRLDVDYTRYAVGFYGDPNAARRAEKVRDRYLSSALMLTYVN